MSAISVVIPTFNRADLIGETIQAVLGQTEQPSEVIVVDDGSTDETAAVLASYAGQVTPIRIDNSGDLVARNVGLRAAAGRFVAFCDSDDIWMPGFLATMAGQWQSQPELTACFSNFCILKDGILSKCTKLEEAPDSFWTGWRQTSPNAGVFEQSCVANLLAFQPFFPSCMMVDRLAFKRGGGWDEGVSRIVGCDFATALRIASLPPVGLVRSALVGIRKHASNISGNTERMNLGDALVLEHVLRTRPELAPFEHLIRQSIAARRVQALDSAFSRRDFAAVRDIYALLPSEARRGRQQVKHRLAALPEPLGAVAALLLGR